MLIVDKQTQLKSPNHQERTISPAVAWAMIIGSFLVVAILGIVVGYKFFWEENRSPSRIEIEKAQYQYNLKHNPNDKDSLVGLGSNYLAEGNFIEAEKYLKKALQIEKNDPMARYFLGILYLKKKDYSQAEKILTQLAKDFPNHILANYQLAITYAESGKNDLAIKTLDHIIKNIDPTYSDVHYLLGSIYEKKGQKSKAIASYKKAVELDPSYEAARKALLNNGLKESDLPQMPSGALGERQVHSTSPAFQENIKK